MTKQKTYNRRKKRKNEHTILKTKVEKLIKALHIIRSQNTIKTFPGSIALFNGKLVGTILC